MSAAILAHNLFAFAVMAMSLHMELTVYLYSISKGLVDGCAEGIGIGS
jgi:hypothetical protein